MKKTLAEAKPIISGFYNALDVTLQKGSARSGPDGRNTDGLIYVLSGQAHYDLDDCAIDAKSGDLLYLAKAVHYSLDVQSDTYHVLLANFSFFPEEGFLCSVSPNNSKSTEARFRHLLTVWQTGGRAEEMECMACLYQIYASFLKTFELKYISPVNRRKMADAQQYINDHLGSPELSVPGVARAVQMSESTFRRTFRAVYRIAPVQYIRMQKITRARERIIYSDESLSRISDDLGFCDVFHFSHIFSREVGCSPSEYRKRFGGNAKT